MQLTATDRPTTTSSRIIVAGVVGNVLEWYDFALFGYFAPVLSQLFFPSEDRLASLLQTFGVFALGYFARPLGGIFFGHLGDRHGRRLALQWSVLLMALPTTLVGLLPTYHQIGPFAAVALTVLRLLQGLSVGGELIGSYSFLGEQANDKRRGFICSWSSVSSGCGMLLGSGTAALLTTWLSAEELYQWGWRIPFLVGILVGVFGLWLRTGVTESEVFQKTQDAGQLSKSPLRAALGENLGAIAKTVALGMPLSIGFYLPFVWLSTWLGHIRQPPLDNALTANTLALALAIAITPFGGIVSDRIGRKRVYVAGAVGTAILAYPVLMSQAGGDFQTALLGQMLFAICAGLNWGTAPAMFVELFPTRTRYSGIAIGYNVGVAIFGGTTPLVATWLLGWSGSLAGPAIYLTIATALSAAVALFTRDCHASPLD